MATAYPRKLKTADARRYADLFLIQNDLRQVIHCCDDLLKRGPEALVGDSRAFLDSALVRYRRCFNGGVRSKLINCISGLDTEQQKLHDFAYDMVDKHIAHSVNEYERSDAVVYVSEEDGKLRVSTIGAAAWLTVEFNSGQINRLKELAVSLLDSVRVESKQLTERLQRHVKELSEEQLQALEDGGDIAIANPKHDKPRK